MVSTASKVIARVYDLLIFIHGRNNAFLERQIKVFVITSVIFIVIIYFVYAISLPRSTSQSEHPL